MPTSTPKRPCHHRRLWNGDKPPLKWRCLDCGEDNPEKLSLTLTPNQKADLPRLFAKAEDPLP